MAKLNQQQSFGRLQGTPFSLGWDGHHHEGNKTYFVRARGRGRISGVYKSEGPALRQAVRIAEDYQAYMNALGMFGSDCGPLRGFPT